MVTRSDGFHHLKYYLAESVYGGTIIHSQYMIMSGLFETPGIDCSNSAQNNTQDSG